MQINDFVSILFILTPSGCARSTLAGNYFFLKLTPSEDEHCAGHKSYYLLCNGAIIQRYACFLILLCISVCSVLLMN